MDTMDLFVYCWFYAGSSVYGHCLTDAGEYTLLTVRNFCPSCYIEGDTLPPSNVAPLRVQHARMATSRDVSSLRPFMRLHFKSVKDMDAFLSCTRARAYMADVPQTSVFLSQVGTDYVGWVRVPGAECRPGDILPLPDRIPYPSPTVVAFDIEVRSSDRGMPQPHRIEDVVEMISVVAFENGQGSKARMHILHALGGPMGIPGVKDTVYSSEMGMIAGFFKLIKEEGATVVTGYNIFGFDMHYLVSRLQMRLLEVPDVSRGIRDSVSIIRVDWSSDAYGHNQYDRLVIGGRLMVDMFLYFKRMKLDRYSLEHVSREFLGEGKKGMPYERMKGAFASRNGGELKEVAEYCVHDSVLVMRLFEKVQMWIDLCEMSKITRCNMEDVYTRGEQMKLVSQCIRECTLRNIVLQPQVRSQWGDYEGAYVIDPKRGAYDGCCTLDFQSLYPSIIIAFNICPSTYCRPGGPRGQGSTVIGGHRFLKSPVGLLPGMIRSILVERKAVREAMHGYSKGTIERTVLDRRQNALKVCANSVYGLMGFEKSRYFGHLGCAESVTTVGRELLAGIVDYIESRYPVRVVYGDTDSCILWHESGAASRDEMQKLGDAVCRDVTSMLPEPIMLKFESYHDKVVLLTKKRYILVDNGKVTYKGVMSARRDYCRFAKDTYEGVIGMVVAGSSGESIKQYIDGRMEALLYAKCSIEDVVITKCLSKRLSAYRVNQPHVVFARRLALETGVDIEAGTRLEYVYVKAVHRVVTPKEATEGRLPLDSEFYISKQIAAQVDDVLSIVGIGCYIKDEWLPVCRALGDKLFAHCKGDSS